LSFFIFHVGWMLRAPSRFPAPSRFGPRKKVAPKFMVGRQDLIVDMANALLNPQPALTRRTLARTSDTEIVRLAGAATAALGPDGYDPAVTLLNTWQTMSGYAHARPWSALRGKQWGEINPDTGMQAVTQKGDPDALLDAAFRALSTVEEAIRKLVALSTAAT
jgi:hypothetical protein